jgi:hypothetical protein
MSKREIPIRDASPSDEPGAGGWGSIRGVAPYKLDGRVLTISTQLKSISDHSNIGYFLYDLLVTQDGAGTDRVNKSRSSIAPQPSVKSQCLNNGWLNFGFTSETHCVTYVGGP